MISVNVKYNNDKSRDFTNPDLPSGDESSPCPPAMSLPSAAAALQLGAPAASLPHMLGQMRHINMSEY